MLGSRDHFDWPLVWPLELLGLSLRFQLVSTCADSCGTQDLEEEREEDWHQEQRGQGEGSEEEAADSEEDASAGDAEELGYNFDMSSIEEYMADGSMDASQSDTRHQGMLCMAVIFQNLSSSIMLNFQLCLAGTNEAGKPAGQTVMDGWLSAKKFQVRRLREACASRLESLEELAGIPAAALVWCCRIIRTGLTLPWAPLHFSQVSQNSASNACSSCHWMCSSRYFRGSCQHSLDGMT